MLKPASLEEALGYLITEDRFVDLVQNVNLPRLFLRSSSVLLERFFSTERCMTAAPSVLSL